MRIDNHGHEHEFEPQFGLPERLPANEKILWQVSPDVGVLARNAFHIRKLAFYFSLLLVARAAPEVAAGANPLQVLLALKWLAPLSVLGLAIAWTLAWLTARTTVYTLTNKRVVMRLGIVLTVTFNLPLSRISAAALRRHGGDFGDITLALSGEDRIAWVHLWPSVRPWRLAQPEPMVRCVAQSEQLALQLSEAWSAATGVAAKPQVAQAGSRTPVPSGPSSLLQASPT